MSARRHAAMCALGAALLAFPAGVAIGISGTLAYGRPPVPQEERRETATLSGALRDATVGRRDPVHERLTKMLEERMRQYLDAYYMANALERELRRVKPDGHKRAQRVIEAEMARREATKQQIKSLYRGSGQ